MNFLEWTNKARDQFADIWVAATLAERNVIEPLVIQFERDLRDNPMLIGESRIGSLRIVFYLPLVVWYHVNGNRVRIVRITRPRQR